MKRSLLAVAAACVALAGCGGSSHHRPVSPSVRLPAARGAHIAGWATQPPAWPLPHVLGASDVQTREMFDSVVVSTVPANPWAVAGYTSGLWPTYLPLVAAFPHAIHLSIAINIGHDADCLDVEPGDAAISQGGWWAQHELALGHKLVCEYTSVSNMPALKANVAAAGVPLNRVKWWCAWYRYVPGLVSGCDAVQWNDHAYGRNLDESTVSADFFGPAGPPAQTVRWYRERNKAFWAYHDHGCRFPQQDNICRHEGEGVVTVQKQLWTVTPRFSCFGPAAKTKALVCWIVRPEASYWTHARVASQRAYDAHLCSPPASFGTPSASKRQCAVWKQRVQWFGQHASALVKAFS